MGNLIVIPHGDRVLVLPDPKQTKMDSGLKIPETVKEKPETGTIQNVGPDSKNKPGMRVMFNKEVGIKVLINDIEHLMIRDTDIYATIR